MRTRFSRWQVLFTAVVIWGGFCAVSVLAEHGPDASTMLPARSVSEFLTPDGRFDLEAARLSGFEGSLDLDGTNLQFDPRTGEPRVRPSAPASLSDDPDDIFWDNSISPSIAGVGGAVVDAIVYDGQLVVGGNFQAAGGVVANCIAAWDGASWSPLGTGMSGGTPYNTPHVNALTVYEGKLIAGGFFTMAGGVVANHIASWDGSSWSSLGSGMGGSEVQEPYVLSLIVHDGKLIAGGLFTTADGVAASNVASWDGSNWSPLGSGMGDGPYPRVYALTVYDGKLIAGGEFTTAGGVVANHIASWDGSSWSPLGSVMGGGTYSLVYGLTVYNDNLIVAGRFTTAGGVAASMIASWDGSNWSPLGSGIEGDPDHYPPISVYSLTVCDGKLIVGGHFLTAGGVAANHIASWDGSNWSPLGSGMVGGASSFSSPYVNALTVYGGKLIAAGDFTTAGGVAANYIASWDGSDWSPMGSGMNHSVYALTFYDGRLIAAGNFTTASGVATNGIAAWDGSSWSLLGSGMDSAVFALTVYNGKLIAGGRFATAGGVAARKIASWDGSSWSPLGLGMGGGIGETYVSALTVYDGKLIAGGSFRTAGDVPAYWIASWNGTSWSWLGFGFGMDNNVYALTVYDGKLIAGGSFSTAGGVQANGIASWDGSSWSPLGSWRGVVAGGDVRALTEYDGKLIVGGTFTGVDGVAASRLASWDGSGWSPLGSGLEGDFPWVSALTVYDGKLIVGGDFTMAGGATANCIAFWNGSSWSPLGSGMSYRVRALTVYDGKLTAGGGFTIAGNKVSIALVQWTKNQNNCCVDRVGNANGVGTYPNEVTISDIQLLVMAKFVSSLPCEQNLSCLAEADVNQSGGANPTCSDVTIADIQTLVYHLFIDGPANAPLKDCL